MATLSGRPVLVATLGTQPQVVTLAVDLLAEDEHVEVEDVYVIHTAPFDRIGEALDRLRQAFDGNRYRGRRCTLNLVEIRTLEGRSVPDIRTTEDARAAFQAIFGTVRERKQARETVHLSIAGGRNSMVVYGAAAAHILFDSDDRLWHIISTEEFERRQDSAGYSLMHRVYPYDAQLSLVPVISWSAWLNHAITMWTEDPFQAFEMQQTLTEQQEDRERMDFLENLTDSEWRTLVAFAHTTQGGSNAQVAEVMHYAPRTVERYFQEIYGKMMDYLALKKEQAPSAAKRSMLMRWFAGFFDRHPELREPPDSTHSFF
ncbi:MAG: hypothetical protein JXA14_23550 [Anaerolineae bacterium]|nr:hypothetical protein [Anaerolineae bacterium]